MSGTHNPTWRHLLSAAVLVSALAAPATARTPPVLVVITGLGGEPRFDERFHAWAATLMDAAGGRYGLPDDRVVYLAADPERDPGRARARSTKENVEAALAELAATPEDAPLFVVVIGHGSFRDGVSKVNLPGPDMTAEDFAAALAPFAGRPLVFANLTSASGEFAPALAGPRRVVITATRSGAERNAAEFARFFASAFVGDDADADKDGRLSVLEAFTYARHEVERAYDREQKLLTEHATLAGDDGLAATLTLGGGPRADGAPPEAAGLPPRSLQGDDPELTRLHLEKSELEREIAALRSRKESLGREDYENQLEDLLIRLALTNRAIRERESRGRPEGRKAWRP